MELRFEKLSQANALEIANNWKYDGEYAFYDMTADPEDYAEFTDEALRMENRETNGGIYPFLKMEKGG